ncbi:hypothetical protein I6F48_00195 [Pseudoalteromonas sp. SWYJ118]|uniref:hypothetical protein n=1 Tax=Pseudoalteromonas sp. SWYJ118 TaxID=2792062 RepID=UPI0018CE2AE0|nr:hypothetical protein [Pseudoalteromonas sp. SWYJ118]MBH0073983.1 hypothetical protein [Pseudoalteromonas sp. SWYJ118]
MKGKILVITLINSIVGTAQATPNEIDFNLYKNDCIEEYKANVTNVGKSDINGIYLRYEGVEKIKFTSIYFMPDLNMGVKFNGVKFSPTYDLNDIDGTYTFYSKKDNDSGRSGLMYSLKDVGDDEYSFSIFKRSGSEKVNGKITSKFEKAKKLNKSKKEPIFEAVFKVDNEHGKFLYPEHTQFPRVCLL